MGSSRHHELCVVQAAYELERDQRQWLSGIVEAARPLLDTGLGLVMYTFELDAQGRFEITCEPFLSWDVGEGELAAIQRTITSYTPSEARMSLEQPFDTASEGHRRHGLDLASSDGFRWSLAAGIADAISCKMVDPKGRGFTLAALLPAEWDTTRPEKARWARVGIHLLAAMRLRDSAPDPDGDAIVDGRGRVVHAAGEARNARDAIRHAATVIDRARSAAGRRDGDAALEAWRALVQGRWSLVDRFESDGRRYLVARRNTPQVGGPRYLSERQRQVLAHAAHGFSNKHIGYALGIAPSTVSGHLRRGMQVLGVRHRGELAALFPRGSTVDRAKDPNGAPE